MTYQPQPVHPNVVVIDLQEFYRTIQCAMCGREDGSHWGLPVCSETGVIIANDDPRAVSSSHDSRSTGVASTASIAP